jgi:uncharacterized protein DUF4279
MALPNMSSESTYGAYVSFRIFAPRLNPDEVIALLNGIIPTHTHRDGEMRKKSSRSAITPTSYTHGMWSITSTLSHDQPLEAHLDHLLTILEPKEAVIRELAMRATVDFVCDMWGVQGFELPALILQRMGALGVKFGVTLYPDVSEADSKSP